MNLARWIFCAATLIVAACSATYSDSPQPGGVVGHLGDHPIEHVVIFAIDGLRRDTLFEYLTTHLPVSNGGLHDLLGVRSDQYNLQFTRAIAARRAVTIFPSYTYPAWTSIFTGVFPGAHGITGNMLFFRESGEARYYGERHLDTVLVNSFVGLLDSDISDTVKTVYEVVRAGGGDSHVIHHMIGRGAERHPPRFGSLQAYSANASRNYDRNAIFETVDALQKYNRDRTAADFRLPTITTIYFAGLDHELHIGGHEAGLHHLVEIDAMIAQLIAGAPVIPRFRADNSNAIDEIRGWKGLKALLGERYARTLFVLASDHGHSDVNWRVAIGVTAIKRAIDGLTRSRGSPYSLNLPRPWTKHTHNGNVVTTLNGGSLGLYIAAGGTNWLREPDFRSDLLPLLRDFLPILHGTSREPEAVLILHEGRYKKLQYAIRSGELELDSPNFIPLDKAFGALKALYPDAERRLAGLLPTSRTQARRYSAPDIIVLADRNRQHTFANDQDPEFEGGRDLPVGEQLKSDHGHLTRDDSLVPIIFASEAFQLSNGQEALSSVCDASVVDITPTVVDILGLFDRHPL
jgi:hypothetical protein